MDLLNSISKSTENFLDDESGGENKSRHRVIFWSKGPRGQLEKFLKKELSPWQLKDFEEQSIQSFSTAEGTLWVLCSDYYNQENDSVSQQNLLGQSLLGKARDLCGMWLRTKKVTGSVSFEFMRATDDEIFGSILGLGLASYNYLSVCRGQSPKCSWEFKRHGKKMPALRVAQATALFRGMNLARHLTNLPAEVANPDNLSKVFAKLFASKKSVKVKVYGEAELKREKCGLLLGVGQGSRFGARLVHLNYKGSIKSKTSKGIALVGKGVTFDTGGLDIKNSSGMRLMKKDMAGVATMAGLCFFVSEIKLAQSCDFYLPLAENAVSNTATRPGDVHEARSGLWVEIDNTDAEGRLVMADAIDFALYAEPASENKNIISKGQKKGARSTGQKRESKTSLLIDVSTLTGAMRVGLGLDIAGFFSNNDQLAKKMERAAQSIGEHVWRMPLFKKYEKSLGSSFADIKNSSDSGFGGAITAALFLQRFVGSVPWIHFDAMSWNTSGDGALSDGANGQCLQAVAQFLMDN